MPLTLFYIHLNIRNNKNVFFYLEVKIGSVYISTLLSMLLFLKYFFFIQNIETICRKHKFTLY